MGTLRNALHTLVRIIAVLFAAVIVLWVLACMIVGVDTLAELPGMRAVGEAAFSVLIIGFIVLGVGGLLFGAKAPKSPTRNQRATRHAAEQERRLEQEEDTRDNGRI